MAATAGQPRPTGLDSKPEVPERVARARREDLLFTAYAALMGVLLGLLALAAVLDVMA